MVLIIFSFILQELASVNAVLLKAYHDGRSLWLIHLLFICATAFDIWAGYEIGKLSQSKFPDSRFVKFVRKWTARAENYIGHHGKKVSLLFLGFINFPLY
jgi:membrane protein DedA with SNARE-associated domain